MKYELELFSLQSFVKKLFAWRKKYLFILMELFRCFMTEAMKMQNKLVIGADGEVSEVHVKEGETVSEEDLLIALK